MSNPFNNEAMAPDKSFGKLLPSDESKFSLKGLANIREGTKVLVLFSGGIDSTVLLYLARARRFDVSAVEFFYEGRSSEEAGRSRRIVGELQLTLFQIRYPFVGIVAGGEIQRDLPQLVESNSFYYGTAGNLAVQLGAQVILGGQILSDWKDHVSTNASPDYYSLLNTMLRHEHGDCAPTIMLPFLFNTKAQVVEIGVGLNVPFELTRSCSGLNAQPCGKCTQCIERINALKANGIPYEQ
jgi:7-cyano-7-deazaguanine synthase